MTYMRTRSAHAALGEQHGSETAKVEGRGRKRAGTAIPSLKSEAAKGQNRKAYGEDWVGGCKILLCGTYTGKGKSQVYWRKKLGWLGSKNARRVYHRYEAVGNPTSPENDGRRYLWVLEKGQWISKTAWLEYKDLALERGRAGKQKRSWKRFLSDRAGEVAA